MKNKFVSGSFFVLVTLSLLAPLWVFKDMLFPFVTSKAFYFRLLIEAALPFYVYLLVTDKDLRPNFKNPLNILAILFLFINIISTFTGVNPFRSMWGNFERMGGTYYIAHLVLLYFYIVMLGKMKGSLSYWFMLSGIPISLVFYMAGLIEFSGVFGYSVLAAAIYGLISWQGANYLKSFLQCFLMVTTFVALNGILGKIFYDPASTQNGFLVLDPSLPGRISSTLGNPIYVGSYLLIPLFLALFLGFEEEGWIWKTAYFLLAVIQLIAMYFSGTRGALVGFLGGAIISAGVYISLMPQKKFRLPGLSLYGLLIASALLLFLNSTRLPEGSTIRRLFTLKDSNTTARFIQWGVALKGFSKEEPIFGIGAENYYYIGNKYFNPKIYDYDKSWFDKPHNFILEILVTNGITGLLAYLGLIFFSIWALWRGYRAGFYNLASFASLLCGFLAYQIQNLTVFDTVPASLTFYGILGFAGYLWQVTSPDELAKNNNKQKNSSKQALLNYKPIAITASVVTLILVVYAGYVTNIQAAEACSNTNYGYAYAGVDKKTSSGYFQKAMDNPFNFDKTEMVSKYGIVVAQWGQAAKTPEEKEFAIEQLNKVIDELNNVLGENGTYAATWETLANAYLIRGYLQSQTLDPHAEEAINKALELSPKRIEARQQLLQLRLFTNKIDDAKNMLVSLVADFPSNSDLAGQLAAIYFAQGEKDKAADLYIQALTRGYVFKNFGEGSWLIDYYHQKDDAQKQLLVLEGLKKTDPKNSIILNDLAILYKNLGMQEKALKAFEELQLLNQATTTSSTAATTTQTQTPKK